MPAWYDPHHRREPSRSQVGSEVNEPTITMRQLILAAILSAFVVFASAKGDEPTTRPTTAPVGSFVPVAKYNALKKDRDALAEQLSYAQEELIRLRQDNENLRHAMRAATQPAPAKAQQQ
jgi:hypothetical protein